MPDEQHLPLTSARGGAREGAGRKKSKAVEIRKKLAEESDGGQAYIDALHEMAIESPDATPAQRLKALEMLFGYMWGRPSTQVPDEPLKVDVTYRLNYTDEELEAMLVEAVEPEAE